MLALSAGLLLAPLVQPLFSRRVFTYNDLAWFHLPMRHLYQQALQAGDSLLWTPALFSGFYLHGEGQTGVFHPLHLLLYRLLPLYAAFDLELIANYVGAFAGMAWLLRRLRCSPVAALTGAMLFTFSGFTLLHHHHINMVAVVAHLPWLLAAADLVIAGDQPRARRLGFAAIAGLIGSAFLLGFPQGVWWDALALGPFALLRAGETGRWRALVPCAAAVVVGVLIGGIQIAPTADLVARSVRAEGSRDFALSYSLHPWNLVQLWSPYALADGAYTARDYPWFHEFGIYSGAILPVALIWVWLRRAALPERRPLIAAATAFAGVMLVLTLGLYGGVAGLLTHLPVLGSMRAPVRYVLLVQVALTLLAAIAVDDLLAIVEGRAPAPSGWMPALWIPAGLGAITLVVLNGRLLAPGEPVFASVAGAAPGVGLVAVVTLLMFLAGRRMRWALAALIVVTAIDLRAYGIAFVLRETPLRPAQLVQALPPAPPEIADAYASAPGVGPFQSNLLVLRGYRLTNGYVGLFPSSRYPLDSERTELLGGARWRFAPDGARTPLANVLPRVQLMDGQRHLGPGTARLLVDRPGRLTLQVLTPARSVVTLTERYHDGWSATANGVEVPIVRVNEDFLGCVVEPGAWRVELRFRPRSFVVGSILSAVGLALVGLVLWLWPARHPPSPG